MSMPKKKEIEMMANSCRVCLKRPKKLRSLYKPLDEGEEPPNQMIQLISGIELERVDEYETLPKCICKSCELSLGLAYQFRMKVLRSHEIIESYRKDIWCNEDNEINANDRTGSPVKVEVVANSNELNDEICLNDDKVKDEFFEITVSDLDPLNMEQKAEERSKNILDLHESNGYMGEDVFRPEYLYDEEVFYSDIDDDSNDMLMPAAEKKHTTADEQKLYLSYENDGSETKSFQDAAPPVETSQSTSENYSHLENQILEDLFLNKSAEREQEEEQPSIKSSLKTKKKSAQEVDNSEPTTTRLKSKTKAQQICDICGNTYPNRGRLTEHRRMHTKELIYTCEICDKPFITREKLRKHMFLHIGGKPLKCSFCSRTFFYESVKKAHEDVHRGVRPYVCDVCNKSFAYSQGLTKHKLIHAKIKMYHCEYCDKDFRLQHHMKQHIETRLHQNAVLAAKTQVVFPQSVNPAMSE